MFKLDKMISADGQHALQDMIELEMYLVAQPRELAWPLLPRSTNQFAGGPHCNPVVSSAVNELRDRAFIEPTSSRTFVVSHSGYEFYKREIKVAL